MSEMDLFRKALEARRACQDKTAQKEGIAASIIEELGEIERRENVKILHCVESGSRAWGFASPDSDYDVRFIYVRPPEFYLRLDKRRDVINWQLDDTYDINGWDITKALTLLHKSNPTLFEWNSSPIVYKTSEVWQNLSELINSYFVAKSGLYHYISTAKANYSEYFSGETVKYKKYFYVLRPILACEWILAEGTPPPMEFSVLMEKYLDPDIKPDVEKLIDIKMNTPELASGEKMSRINDYIERTIPKIEEQIEALPPEKTKGFDDLNRTFIEILNSK